MKLKVSSKVTTVTFNFITKQDFQNYQYNNISTQNEQKNRGTGMEEGGKDKCKAMFVCVRVFCYL